jgi:UDP-glucose:(heptosyl)LPS alpha-1,3-glucosyltransferase
MTFRIALIRQRYTPFGGAERFVSRAMDALGEQGASVTIVTREWQGETTHQSLICNPFHIGRLWRDWSFARCVCNALKEAKFDLVQSHERLSCCDIYRAGDGVHREWLTQRSRVLGPLARLGMMMNPYHRYVLAAEKHMFHSRQLKGVICNSRMVKEEIMRHFGLPESKLHVIYSGVDTEAFHPRLREQHRLSIRQQLGIPELGTLFLFVGSGFERKGLAASIQALAKLDGDTYLAVVGKDRHQAKFESLARHLGISDRVRFLGGQPDVKPYYGAADALVLPTLYDPFPNVALEAMACGLPVITSTKSGAAEIIEQGKNGYVCDALDISSLAQHMKQITKPGYGESLGAAARERVSEFSLEAMGEKLMELYRSFLRQ